MIKKKVRKRKAKKLIRSSRNDLVLKLCRMLNLPKAKKTYGYFTRNQLLEMINKIDNMRLTPDA